MPIESQVVYEMLATASIWVLDMLFDDSRDLYGDAQPVRNVSNEILSWFDGLTRYVHIRASCGVFLVTSVLKLLQYFNLCQMMYEMVTMGTVLILVLKKPSDDSNEAFSDALPVRNI